MRLRMLLVNAISIRILVLAVWVNALVRALKGFGQVSLVCTSRTAQVSQTKGMKPQSLPVWSHFKDVIT